MHGATFPRPPMCLIKHMDKFPFLRLPVLHIGIISTLRDSRNITNKLKVVIEFFGE
jgi:hypothetical protein